MGIGAGEAIKNMDESRYRQNQASEHEWQCTKCNNWCLVEPDEDHYAYSQSWCDECNDTPGGFVEGVPDAATEIGRMMAGE